jgi:hypothetical protein
MRKRLLGVFVAAAGLSAFGAAPALAAVPDGAGPWADSVAGFTQGLRQDGSPVLPARSDPTAALGVAERSTDPSGSGVGTFVSLGFGGHIDLGFDNRICNQEGDDLDIELVEATQEPYADELVDVYVSKDGVSYTLAASNVNKDATIGLPAGMEYAKYVRLVDKTNPAVSETNADGYDVDGVQALAPSSSCEPPPPDHNGKMYGGGFTKFNKTWTRWGWKYEQLVHGLKIYCQPNKGTDFLAAYWGRSYFLLKQVTERKCSDDPTISPTPPPASFDTIKGKGTGIYNGKPGTVEFEFTDAGEPGAHKDHLKLVIKDSYGHVVLNVDEKIDCGNQQAIDLS